MHYDLSLLLNILRSLCFLHEFVHGSKHFFFICLYLLNYLNFFNRFLLLNKRSFIILQNAANNFLFNNRISKMCILLKNLLVQIQIHEKQYQVSQNQKLLFCLLKLQQQLDYYSQVHSQISVQNSQQLVMLLLHQPHQNPS